MPKRIIITSTRAALYGTAMASMLWYLYGFRYQIETGLLSREAGFREVTTMTSIMIFVPLVAWLFTWKLEAEYGTLVAVLTSGFLTGAGLVLFTYFVLGTLPALARNTRVFFEEDAALAFFFIVIPVAAVTSALVVALTSPLVRKYKIDPGETPPDDWRTLKL